MKFVNPKPMATAMIAAMVVVLAGGAVSAQERGRDDAEPRQPRFIRFLDTDGDGKVSLAEIAAEQKRLIAAADVNGDGKLSADEFRRRGRMFMRLHATTLFDLMDTDGDKQLTEAEITTPSGRWFARYDANGDKALVADELPQRRHGRRGRRGGMRR